MHKYRHWQTDSCVPLQAAAGAFFWILTSFLCCFSAVFMARDIFPEWELSNRAWAWILGAEVLMILLYESGMAGLARLRIFFGLLIPCMYAWAVFRFWKLHRIEIEDGACAAAVQFLEKFNSHLKTSYSIWEGKTEFIGLGLAFWVFVIASALLFAALLFRKRAVLLLFPAAVFAAELVTGFVPQWKSMAFSFAALLFMQADGGADALSSGHARKSRYARMHARADGRRTVRWYVRWIPSVCLAGALAFMLPVSSRLSDTTLPSLMKQAPKVMEFQRKTEQNAAEMLRGFTVPGQESVTNQAPHYTGKEMFRVTASKKPFEDVLLKGFIGTDYRNGRWVCENGKFKEACAEAGYEIQEAERELLHAQYDAFENGGGYTSAEILYSSQFSENAAANIGEIEYTIEHTGIRGRQAYLPYAVDYAGHQGRERLSGDVTLQRAWNQKDFTFRAWNYTMGESSMMWRSDAPVSAVFAWYDDFARNRYLDVPEEVPLVEEYMNQMTGRDTYLELKYYLDAAELCTEAVERSQARLNLAQMICTYLKFYQQYSTDLTPPPQGEDPVHFFLMRSHKGYCVHFASAAVMLFRRMGIPARYVSGYAVRAEDFTKKGGSYAASVKDEDAHAWAEIYLDEFGWVPVDATPGERQRPDWLSREDFWNPKTAGTQNQEQTETDDTGADKEEETQTDTDEAEKEQTKEQHPDTAADSRKNGNGLSYAAFYLLTVLLCWLIWQSVRFYVMAPQRDIRAGKYSRAVRRMNRRIYRKLCLKGKIRQPDLTDARYEQLLKNSFQKISDENWSRFMQAARAAAFAPDEIPKAQAEFCWQIYQALRQRERKSGSYKNSDYG